MKANFSGNWTLDVSKSSFVGQMPKALSMKIEHTDSALQQQMLVTRADGSEQRIAFKCRMSANPSPGFLNGRVVRSAANWRGGELAIESWIQVGESQMRFCDYWSLSSDGQTLSMQHRDDGLAGQLAVLQRSN